MRIAHIPVAIYGALSSFNNASSRCSRGNRSGCTERRCALIPPTEQMADTRRTLGKRVWGNSTVGANPTLSASLRSPSIA
jgi:hypothetical protein